MCMCVCTYVHVHAHAHARAAPAAGTGQRQARGRDARGVCAAAGVGDGFPGGPWGAGAPTLSSGCGAGSSMEQHSTARRIAVWWGSVCSCTPPMSAPVCGPAPRQAGSRWSGQSMPERGQLSMLGGRLFPLPKSGQSLPHNRVHQHDGDNGKMLRQHSWQPSARCSTPAAPLLGREEKHRPLAGVRAEPVLWVGNWNRMGFGKETKTQPRWVTDD